ncbi:hypothetical protein Ato02nite_097290 [Paractinoplanes toevensis]|uniref:Uncharacterized protein n=1 Tax=Paractinoplanes toevensis TaxID=571911 RepID=A0A920BRT1_9ACTN|nr:hypothetical protein Ato02nite_097290 [Actinoplanes toevensis]
MPPVGTARCEVVSTGGDHVTRSALGNGAAEDDGGLERCPAEEKPSVWLTLSVRNVWAGIVSAGEEHATVGFYAFDNRAVRPAARLIQQALHDLRLIPAHDRQPPKVPHPGWLQAQLLALLNVDPAGYSGSSQPCAKSRANWTTVRAGRPAGSATDGR